MNREAMTRGIICSLVDRILKEAETDPDARCVSWWTWAASW